MAHPVRTLWRTYRRTGSRGAAALARYYVERVRASVAGPGRQCPVCNWEGPEFDPLVYPEVGAWRRRARCPHCGSLERHRALWFAYNAYFRDHPRLARVLHFAAEPCFRPLFLKHSSQYITSDYGYGGEVRLDLEDLGLRDESIDLVVATGVFMCVRDLSRAVDNLYRVLAPGGTALICDIVGADKRTQEIAGAPFGQRRFIGGLDIAERFAPFETRLLKITDFVPERDGDRFGVGGGDFGLIWLDK